MIKNPALFVTENTQTGDRFAIRLTTRKDKINFWYASEEHKYLYTFAENANYNRKTEWTEDLCRQLLKELTEENSKISIFRHAIDDVYIFNSEEKNDFPKMPRQPKEFEKYLAKMKIIERRAKIEKDHHSGPAPFILYGKHNDYGETELEFAWKLTPDKPKRQNIKPGDLVLVWTKFGFKKVTVTRIEKAAPGQKQPECRVKKKLK